MKKKQTPPALAGLNCHPDGTKIGLARFVTKYHATKYYAAYGFTAADVETKIEEAEIEIGPPKPSPEFIFSTDRDGRYWQAPRGFDTHSTADGQPLQAIRCGNPKDQEPHTPALKGCRRFTT